MAVTDKRRSTLIATAGILVALVAINTAAWFLLRGVRVDVTEEKLYSLSPGVREIMKKLPEPVRIDFYWTREQGADLPQIRSYAQRVQEFLEELAGASDGQVELRVIDPEPFSETEEMARSAGIAPRTLDATGRVLMLGLAVRGPTDKVEAIPFLSPDQEPFLEYEIARKIISVGRGKKAVVAVLSTLPETRQPNPNDPSSRGGGKTVLFQQLDQMFDVRRVDPQKPEIPADATALVLMQPRTITEDGLKAIDAWALAGKPLLVFADPWCEWDPAAQTMDFGKTGAGSTYDLGPVMNQWGAAIDKLSAVCDRGYATRIMYRSQGGQVMEMSHPAWLSMRKDTFSSTDPVTAQIAQMNLKGAGAIEKLADGTTTVTPLIWSTKDSMMIQTIKLGFFGEVDRLMRDFKSLDASQIIGARITGPIESAYPDANGVRAKGEANIVLIADADMLDDETWIAPDEQTGGVRTIADNGAFVFNALELATGDKLLSGLRARGGYKRPFEKVEELRKAAETRYLTREQDLQDQIKKGEMRITELQRERGASAANVDANGFLTLSPEQAAELKKLEQTSKDARKELREVQRSLRSDIERTGTWLMVINVVLWPLGVATIATAWISLRYRRQRTK